MPLIFSLSLFISLLLAFHLDSLLIDREEALSVLDNRAGPGKRLVGIECGVGGRFELVLMSGVDSGKVGVSCREKERNGGDMSGQLCVRVFMETRSGARKSTQLTLKCGFTRILVRSVSHFFRF